MNIKEVCEKIVDYAIEVESLGQKVFILKKKEDVEMFDLYYNNIAEHKIIKDNKLTIERCVKRTLLFFKQSYYKIILEDI